MVLLAGLYLAIVVGGRVGDLRAVPSTGDPVHRLAESRAAPAPPPLQYLTPRRHLPLTQRVDVPTAAVHDLPWTPPVGLVRHFTPPAGPPFDRAARFLHVPPRAPPLS